MTELPENSDSAFVSDETSTEHVRFLGAVITIVADADATDGALTVTEIDAPPGYENNLHTHRPSELFYVLSGEMTLHVDGEAYVLQSGTTGIVPSAAPHGFRVTGEDPLRVLAIFTPAGMEEFFREAGTPVDSRTIPEYHGPSQEDLDRMAVVSPRYDIRRIGPLPDS